jgi:hypothetical protein
MRPLLSAPSYGVAIDERDIRNEIGEVGLASVRRFV